VVAAAAEARDPWSGGGLGLCEEQGGEKRIKFG
jgi:hypothetical protein